MASLPDVASQDGSLGFTRGLMKTWHFTNFWQILLGCQLTHKQIKILKKNPKKRLMTCSRRTRRWKVLPEKQNPNEQTNSLSHWAWARDQWGYWKLSLHPGSVPKSLLLHLRGPTYFCWHGTRMVSWGWGEWHPGVWKITSSLLWCLLLLFHWVMTLLLCPGWEFLGWPFCLVGFLLDDMSSSLKFC